VRSAPPSIPVTSARSFGASVQRHQVWAYVVATVLGVALGARRPAVADVLEVAVWPALAALLLATFTQTPLAAIRAAMRDRRFFVTALVANFVLLPMLVWALVGLVPADDALRLGLLLVLLVPCTDWFITFTQLGRGDTARAVALTPMNLVLQLVLLPVYLWLLAGPQFSISVRVQDLWPALVVVLGPLLLAISAEPLLRRQPAGERVRAGLGHAPVPLLAAVIFAVAASNAETAWQARTFLPVVLAVVTAFLVGALLLAKVSTAVVGLSAPAGRTLAFTLATRNSFVVLPVALALPAGWELAALVVVMQSLVELLSMIICLRVVPRWVVPDR